MPIVGSAQTNGCAPGASVAVTKTGVTAGNSLFFIASWALQAGTKPSTPPSDTGDSGWTTDYCPDPTDSFNSGVSIYSRHNCTAGDHTVTLTQTNFFCRATLVEWSGVQSTPLDKTNTNFSDTDVTSGTSGASGTLSQANEVVFGAICVNPPVGTSDDGLTTPSGWSVLHLYTNTTVNVGTNHVYKEVSDTSSQTVSWTWTESSHYRGLVATYKITAGGSISLLMGGICL